jgi:hypothetical protein
MKIIITEEQLNDLTIERYAKIFDKIISIKYPNLYQKFIQNRIIRTEEYEFWDSEDENELIFFTDDDNDFKVSTSVLDMVHNLTSLDIFDFFKIRGKNHEIRKIFDEIMKRYARKYLGISVNDVWLYGF